VAMWRGTDKHTDGCDQYTFRLSYASYVKCNQQQTSLTALPAGLSGLPVADSSNKSLAQYLQCQLLLHLLTITALSSVTTNAHTQYVSYTTTTSV